MGPRFRKRGNAASASAAIIGRKASMGPRFRKRGNLLQLPEAVALLWVASMGPRFRKRGNSTPRMHFRHFGPSFNGAALSEARKQKK